jgi:hypothetical protein
MSQVTTSWTPLDPSVMRNHQRAYELLGNDLLKIFEFVEPVQPNAACFGHQIYQLFLRINTEFESICKLACGRLEIQPERNNDWNFDVYEKLQDREGKWSREPEFPTPVGNLSDYRFDMYSWGELISPLSTYATPLKVKGEKSTRKPGWYSDYNDVKHSREKEFNKANLENLITSFCGLVAILDWQGIKVNRWIPETVGNEIVVGEKFGYFVIGADQSISQRVYF